MKVLDLNSLQIPTMELIFTDAARTTVHIAAPTEALINELESWVKGGLDPLAKGDQASVKMSYDLIARILSYNEEGLAFTGDTLRETYKVNLWTLIAIANSYMEFIASIKNEKN